MSVTVLWEDQRGGLLKGFGPHELLVSCVSERLELDRWHVGRLITSVPKKGKEKVLAALREDLRALGDARRVCAVFDKDRAHEMFPPGRRPTPCNQGLTEAVRSSAAGDYKLVFLVRNVESLLDAAATRLGEKPAGKPDPDQRDRLLNRAAHGGLTREGRVALAAEVAGFARLVDWAASRIV
jgi:hypothetical protein